MSSRPSRGTARLAAILDSLPDALVLVNTNGTVVNANTIALQALESPGTALVGRGLLDLLPQFDSRLIPGSMRRPDAQDERGRTKPLRMIARRTDGGEFPVEVTSASINPEAQSPGAYSGPYEDASRYSGDELLMIVIRDLTGTVDTEAELARSQRQTEMILRAAAEGVVGTDTEGHVVLVNPAAAQILGHRASDLGGRELHPLVLHSRADGTPFPYAESPLADTLRSGRKHRVRGQVLWNKKGEKVPVDLTTAPVRDGDQLVGAVMTFTDRRAYEELVERHAAESAEARESHTNEVAGLRESHAAEVAELTEGYEARIAELDARHEEAVAQAQDRYAALAEREKDRFEALAARHEQLLAVLETSLRGPLDELRRELGTLAADPAGQLWPEANQILHHLTAGYSRMTTLVDNVLSYQRLDVGTDTLHRRNVMLDAVVQAGVDGAVELIGPGRAQFAVHAPPIEAQVDPERLATALAHLVADVAGIDATGNARQGLVNTGWVDSTIVVAAAQRGDAVRIEVRGPYPGGDPVHGPIVTGIVRAHGGVLQSHTVPGMGGATYVLDVPLGEGAGAVAAPVAPRAEAGADDGTDGGGAGTGAAEGMGDPDSTTSGHGRRRARRSSVDAFLESDVEAAKARPTGRRRRPSSEGAAGPDAEDTAGGAAGAVALPAPGEVRSGAGGGSPFALPAGTSGSPGAALAVGGAADGRGHTLPHGAVVTAAEHAAGTAAASASLGPVSVPPGGMPVRVGAAQSALAPALPLAAGPEAGSAQPLAVEAAPAETTGAPQGRRARRAAARAAEEAAVAAETGPRMPFALPPAAGDAEAAVPTPTPVPAPALPAPLPQPAAVLGWDAAEVVSEAPSPAVPGGAQGVMQPPIAAPPQPVAQPVVRPEAGPAAAQGPTTNAVGAGQPLGGAATPHADPMTAPVAGPAADPAAAPPVESAAASPAESPKTLSQPLPAEEPVAGHEEPQQGATTRSGRAFSVRTLGAGVPFDEGINGPHPAAGQLPAQAAQQLRQARLARRQGQPAPGTAPGTPAHGTGSSGSGRRRKLATPQDREATTGTTTTGTGTAGAARPAPHSGDQEGTGARPHPASADSAPHPPLAAPPLPPVPPHTAPAHTVPAQSGPAQVAPAQPVPPRPVEAPAAAAAQQRLAGQEHGRSYAIGAPDAGAEGPEPLDGPNGAVEVANRPAPRPQDDELPPEPLDNPRRLLVWPAPDASTQAALSDRGYRPVVVSSRDEVDAQIAAFPAALFVDPLTGPITRTALQSLRQAAVAAEVPVLVTAGLGAAAREAAYGADPAVLLKALAPRDSEQHPPRVLLVEEREELAGALTAALERRAMQVTRAADDAQAVAAASQVPPNLVVLDLMQVRRRRAGIIDWLRANGQLNRTPLVVYTAPGMGPGELAGLATGEAVLFLAERSTSEEVQTRIVDLLAKIGTN
ncbi:PAS domain-containing protein [Streptomyces sp. NPDC047046]|uniref:PAS domain-containing protein n=1 Tax=Streptomyces sp. NPDC047046 TaxID=3155378 RepID=UPI0033DC6DC2